MPRTVSVKITSQAYKLAKRLAEEKGCFIGKLITDAIIVYSNIGQVRTGPQPAQPKEGAAA